MFLKTLPKLLFGAFGPLPDAQKSPYWIFWVVFGAPLDFKGSPKSPQIAQVAPKIQILWKDLACFSKPGTDLLPRSLLERSWAPFWSIWDGFWMNFDGFWYHFSMHFGFFCNKICRLPTSSDTKRIDRNVWENAKNRQELTKTKS